MPLARKIRRCKRCSMSRSSVISAVRRFPLTHRRSAKPPYPRRATTTPAWHAGLGIHCDCRLLSTQEINCCRLGHNALRMLAPESVRDIFATGFPHAPSASWWTASKFIQTIFKKISLSHCYIYIKVLEGRALQAQRTLTNWIAFMAHPQKNEMTRRSSMSGNAPAHPLKRSPHKLKLGVFGLNVSSGCSMTERPDTLKVE